MYLLSVNVERRSARGIPELECGRSDMVCYTLIPMGM